MSRTYRCSPSELEKGKTFRDGLQTMATPPGWWINQYMNIPKRRVNTRLCYQILKGADSDNITWPLGNHKPHVYYW
jgi:hypothetical protein